VSDSDASITREEAAAALRDISQTESLSSAVYGYSKAAPHLILWGFVWLVGYGAMAGHVTWPYLWPVLSSIGSAGSFWIGYRASQARGGVSDWRPVATFFVVFLFIAALFTVMPPHEGEQIGAFFPLFVALFYALAGIWGRAPRMVVTAAALAVLTLFGFFELRAYFALWMAIVGGGGLILGGLWMRSI
jgi:hypothetical protein